MTTPKEITISPTDREAQLKRIAAEKDCCVNDFMQRYQLLCRQEEALTTTRTPTGPPKRLVRTWEKRKTTK